MPRGKRYSEELREEARRLRRAGWSLNEIAAKLGPPKNTLTAWLRDIELTPEQQARLREKEKAANERNRALANEAHRRARLERIDAAKRKAETFLKGLEHRVQINHIAAAMLYLGEGAKGEGVFAFGNSNPRAIAYWLHLLRTSFTIDESKFSIQLMIRADQREAELIAYWTNITGIKRYVKSSVDPRTSGRPPTKADYKGVCHIYYFDVGLRRYLDALADGLITRALGEV